MRKKKEKGVWMERKWRKMKKKRLSWWIERDGKKIINKKSGRVFFNGCVWDEKSEEKKVEGGNQSQNGKREKKEWDRCS